MALDGYVSDLESEDRLRPVRYTMSPFVVREYCHGVGEFREEFHAKTEAVGEQLAPPTLVHIDKIRLIHRNCPLGPGPNARIHFQFQSKHHRPIPVGKDLEASGIVSGRYEKKGRLYLDIDIELRMADTNELIMEYRDTAILSYGQRRTA
jgi:hypothetical protein